MRTYRQAVGRTPVQRIEVVLRRQHPIERLVGGVVRLTVEITVWVFCGWSGLPYPERLKS